MIAFLDASALSRLSMLECRVGPQRRGDQESLEQRRPHGEWPASVAWSNAVEWLLEG